MVISTLAPAGIYRIRHCESGKSYIGSSLNIKSRWVQHKCHLRKGNHRNSPLQSAFNEYGEGAFVFEVIFHCPEHMLREQEQVLFDMGFGDYNIARSVVSPKKGIRHSAETLAKIRGQRRTPKQIQRMRDAARRIDQRPGAACREAHARYAKRRSKPIEAWTLDGKIERYASITEAHRAGFNERSVGRALKSGKVFKDRIWTFVRKEDRDEAARNYQPKESKLVVMPIEAHLLDGTIESYPSIRYAKNHGFPAVHKALKKGTLYKDRKWVLASKRDNP